MDPELIGHGRYLFIGSIKSPHLGNAIRVPGVSLSQFQSLRSGTHLAGPMNRDISVRVTSSLNIARSILMAGSRDERMCSERVAAFA